MEGVRIQLISKRERFCSRSPSLVVNLRQLHVMIGRRGESSEVFIDL